jgi:hypothetical protein
MKVEASVIIYRNTAVSKLSTKYLSCSGRSGSRGARSVSKSEFENSRADRLIRSVTRTPASIEYRYVDHFTNCVARAEVSKIRNWIHSNARDNDLVIDAIARRWIQKREAITG